MSVQFSPGTFDGYVVQTQADFITACHEAARRGCSLSAAFAHRDDVDAVSAWLEKARDEGVNPLPERVDVGKNIPRSNVYFICL